jgi:uncharacterized membrane protein YfcA
MQFVIGFIVIVAVSAVLATVNADWGIALLLWLGVAVGAYIAVHAGSRRNPR